MRCPFCSHSDTKVVDSRLSAEGALVRRRRECTDCGVRFTTHEQMELFYPKIVKRDGSRDLFAADKLRAGIERALERRPVPVEEVDNLVQRIQFRLHGFGERECSSNQLGEWVMDELKELDEVAYVRFASVYRSFEDVNAFREEVDRLQQVSKQSRLTDK